MVNRDISALAENYPPTIATDPALDLIAGVPPAELNRALIDGIMAHDLAHVHRKEKADDLDRDWAAVAEYGANMQEIYKRGASEFSDFEQQWFALGKLPPKHISTDRAKYQELVAAPAEVVGMNEGAASLIELDQKIHDDAQVRVDETRVAHELAVSIKARRDKLGRPAKAGVWLAGMLLTAGASFSASKAMTTANQEVKPSAKEVLIIDGATTTIFGLTGAMATSFSANVASRRYARRRAKKLLPN